MTDSPSTKQATETGKSDAAKAAELEKEFDDKVAKPGPQDDPVRQYVVNKMQSEEVEARNKGIADTVAALKKDSSLDAFNDSVVRGWAYDYASRNPEFNEAFKARSQNPQKWEAALDKARNEAAKEFPAQDRTRQNLRAAHLATRGTSSEVPKGIKKTDAEINQMTDHEFRKYKASLGDFAPAR